jgi:hypothetical protein
MVTAATRQVALYDARSMLRIASSPLPSKQLTVPSKDELAQLQDEFQRRHRVMIPRLLDLPLAEEIARRIEAADFYRREHEGIGVEACMDVNATLAWLLLLVNDVRMFAAVRSITGCPPIGHFEGRVYRFQPGGDHHDSWHDDVGEGRLLAMSINVGAQPFTGGAVEIRERRTSAIAAGTAAGIGDALLFELGEDLEHRVLPVYGGNPRTVFAGWFKSGMTFLSVLESSILAEDSAFEPSAVD